MLLRNFTLLLLILLFWGCTSHPPVLPQTPMKGQTNSGFALSAENVIPVIWWKHGLNRYTEIGFKMGIPFSGTGIDFSRVLSKRDRKWEVLNIAYSLSPNSSFDLTYYVFKGRKNRDLEIRVQDLVYLQAGDLTIDGVLKLVIFMILELVLIQKIPTYLTSMKDGQLNFQLVWDSLCNFLCIWSRQ